ncbi:MAG TPA: Hsp20/alpha crystallin family protein [Acidimicrobiales bacterium]|nr:Hsp20/alpha crystallin family protein [Acidimicrobiales bacterium]
MLMRTDPFRELDRLTQQALGTRVRPTAMPMDAYREGDHFVVRFDLPGVEATSIELTVEKNVLTVAAERQWQPSETQEVVASERPQGSFSRQLFLGEGLDPERVEANYENGVLTVTVPVAEQAKPRKITVNTGSGGGKAKSIDTTSAAA